MGDFRYNFKVIVFIGWMGMGTLIFLLKSNDRRALLLSALLIITGATFTGTMDYLYEYLPAWIGVIAPGCGISMLSSAARCSTP